MMHPGVSLIGRATKTVPDRFRFALVKILESWFFAEPEANHAT